MACPSKPPCRFDTKVESQIQHSEKPADSVNPENALALAVLIVANVTCVVLESVESIRRHFAPAFDVFEQAATAIFAVEYVLRVWTSVDFRNPWYHDPILGRFRYMRSFFALVDLVAVLPAILGFFGAADFRVLRLLRLLRMLKLVRHSTTFGLLFSVLREEARAVTALLFVLLLTVTISGSLMYMLEGEEPSTVFTSIPAAMWWATETLTTVGYGDMVPVTAVGRILGGVVSVVGIAALALFSGLITVGFIDQLKIHREQQSRLKVAVSEETALVRPSYRTDGHGRERVQWPEISTVVSDRAMTGRPVPGICPHCGSVFSNSTLRGGGNDKPFSA